MWQISRQFTNTKGLAIEWSHMGSHFAFFSSWWPFSWSPHRSIYSLCSQWTIKNLKPKLLNSTHIEWEVGNKLCWKAVVYCLKDLEEQTAFSRPTFWKKRLSTGRICEEVTRESSDPYRLKRSCFPELATNQTRWPFDSLSMHLFGLPRFLASSQVHAETTKSVISGKNFKEKYMATVC